MSDDMGPASDKEIIAALEEKVDRYRVAKDDMKRRAREAEAEVRRLRKLVRKTYDEGYGDGHGWTEADASIAEQCWLASKARRELGNSDA